MPIHEEIMPLSNSEMSNFRVEQGRTREAYMEYVAAAKPAENAAQREKGHFWMDTS